MSPMSARTSGVDAGLDCAVLARHRCRPDGLCTCGMDREACPVARQVRMLLRRYLYPPPPASVHRRRVAAASPTGPGRVSPSMAARPGASLRIDLEGR